jgi:hypothetical protein
VRGEDALGGLVEDLGGLEDTEDDLHDEAEDG